MIHFINKCILHGADDLIDFISGNERCSGGSTKTESFEDFSERSSGSEPKEENRLDFEELGWENLSIMEKKGEEKKRKEKKRKEKKRNIEEVNNSYNKWL